jgi:hypothetical protein
MIKLQYVRGGFAPMVFCDMCHQRISDAGMAATVNRSDAVKDGDFLDFAHVHKGACMRAAEAQLGGLANTGWTELCDHLRYIVHNTGTSLQQLQEREDLWGDMGL